MKAIETEFKGYRFRSRLEARWAVFFDTLGLQWEYEPEGFELPGGYRYLPDFKVLYPGSSWEWFEVKSDLERITPNEWGKLTAFARERHLMLLDGAPAARTYVDVTSLFNPEDAKPRRLPEGTPSREMLRAAQRPERSGVVLWSHKQRLWGDEHSNVFRPPISQSSIDEQALFELFRAIEAARSARFEFGAKGRA